MICAACRHSHRASEFNATKGANERALGAPPSGAQTDNRLSVNKCCWNQGDEPAEQDKQSGKPKLGPADAGRDRNAGFLRND